jgi:ribonuclease BN (tRNA processing enzyme)
MVRMATELVLLGPAGAPAPVAGRAGISSALAVDGRVFVVDCGRGTPSGYLGAGLDFARLEAVFITHLHVDHVGDLAGLLLYPWGLRAGPDGSPPPVQVYGPRRPGLHTDVTEVGGVAQRAGVRELILTHYLPAEPDAVSAADWAGRAGQGFAGRTIAGRDGLRRTLPDVADQC